MRNNRSALWALGMAGAAYLWRNRDKVRGQLNGLRNQAQQRTPLQLPDTMRRLDEQPRTETVERPRDTRFGGTDV